MNDILYVLSMERIGLGEYGERNTNAIVVTKIGAFVEEVSSQD